MADSVVAVRLMDFRCWWVWIWREGTGSAGEKTTRGVCIFPGNHKSFLLVKVAEGRARVRVKACDVHDDAERREQ